MKRYNSLLSIGLCFTAFLAVSCAKSDTAESNLADSATPAPVQRQAPAIVNWLQMHEEFKPPISGIGDCEKPFKFTVDHSGAYTAGPCKSHGSVDTGYIDVVELDKLERLASDFATADLSFTSDCDFGIHFGSDVVYIVMPPNSKLSVKSYKSWSLKTCYHGGRGKAGPLSSYLRDLLKKYYPRS